MAKGLVLFGGFVCVVAWLTGSAVAWQTDLWAVAILGATAAEVVLVVVGLALARLGDGRGGEA